MMDVKPVTSPEEKKTVVEEKRFAIFTKESIRVIAEAAGYADLPDNIAGLLGEDVGYHLREVAQNSAQYMKHARRRRLTTADVNKALRNSDVQPIYGHGGQDAAPFKQSRDGELHFVEEQDVNFSNIASSSYVPRNIGQTTIKAHWLAVEGVAKTTSLSQTPLGKVPLKHELSEDLLLYYDNTTKAILGLNNEVMKAAFVDLRTNPNIVPLLPYFVNFISNGVKTVSHDISQLTKLLYTANAIISNRSLYLEPSPYLSLLVQGVVYCVLEPLAASINPLNDHWVLRDYAARLLAQIINRWTSPVNHLRYNTIKTLKEALYDLAKPSCCHYGAVMGLLALGCKAVQEVLLPHLATYWSHLNLIIEDNSYANAQAKADAFKVYGAIQMCAEFILRNKIMEFERQHTLSEDANTNMADEDDEISTTDQAETAATSTNTSASILFEKTPYELYKELYEYFGDSLCIKLPPVKTDHIFKPTKKENIVTLTDANSGKTGEELLDEFMEQVRIQEEIDRIRREEERVKQEQLERERKERDRIEQIRLAKEQKRLAEEHRKQEEANKRQEAARKQQEQLEFERNEDRRRLEDELRRAQEERFRADEERRLVDERRRQRIMEDKERKRIAEEKKLRQRQPMDKKRLKEEELRRQAEERQHHIRLAEDRDRQRQMQMIEDRQRQSDEWKRKEDLEKHSKQKRWLEMSRQEDATRLKLEHELIDVEAHSDGSDEAQDDIDVEEIKSDNSDEKSEEDTPPPILTVKNRISDPKGGVRLTIMKRPRLTMHLSHPSSAEAKPERSSKESKHGKRRKQTRDMESFEYVPFEDISAKQLYSPDTESSSDGQHPKITLKLKVKDPKDNLSSPRRDAFK